MGQNRGLPEATVVAFSGFDELKLSRRMALRKRSRVEQFFEQNTS